MRKGTERPLKPPDQEWEVNCEMDFSIIDIPKAVVLVNRYSNSSEVRASSAFTESLHFICALMIIR